MRRKVSFSGIVKEAGRTYQESTISKKSENATNEDSMMFRYWPID